MLYYGRFMGLPSQSQASQSSADDALLARFRSKGCVILEDVIGREALQAALRSLEESQDPAQGTQGGIQRSDRYNKAGKVEFTKIPNLAKTNEAFRQLASTEGVVNAVESLLGQKALVFRDVLILKPARDGAPLDYHQDSEYWDVEPRALISAWIPFRDVGLEDGCLRVIEGSHSKHYRHDIQLGEDRALPYWMTSLLRKMASLSGTGDSDASGFSSFRKLKNSLLGGLTKHFTFLGRLQDLHASISEDEKQREANLPIRAGSVILFHSMLLHASNPNISDRDRHAYIVSYMGSEYFFSGVGKPEFLVARERARRVFQEVRRLRG